MGHQEPSNAHDDSWIDRDLRTLAAPATFQPDVSGARVRLARRAARAARHRRELVASLVAAIVLLVALPGSRAIAAQLWQRLVLGRVVVVNIERPNLPESVTAAFTMTPSSSRWTTIDDRAQAERLVGFRLMLPASGVPGMPGFQVIENLRLTTSPLKVDDIQQALRAAGITDVDIPGAWEGTTLVAEGGPVIVAVYRDDAGQRDVQVMQAAPFHMTTSSSLQFGDFMTLAFRVFGAGPAAARERGSRLQTNPGLVMHFPGRATAIDVPLRSGEWGVLVGEGQPEGAGFFWSTPGRIFALSSETLTPAEAATIANSVQ